MIRDLPMDEDLVKGCCNGDRLMQEILFAKFSKSMMGICRRYSVNKMDAEDRHQDGFMHVFQQIELFKGGSLEAWIRKVFINHCLGQIRKDKRTKSWFLEVTDEMETIIKDKNDSWAEALEVEEMLQLIEILPVGAKTVFNLAVIEGYSHAEISKILDIAESASRSQLTRARQTMQAAYLKNTQNGKIWKT